MALFPLDFTIFHLLDYRRMQYKTKPIMIGPHSPNYEEQYGRRLLAAVVDETAKSNPHKVFASIPKSSDLSDGWRNISAVEIAHAVNYVAWWIRDTIGINESFETLAYLGASDVRYAVFCLAAIKTGYKTLLPSPRNQDRDTIYLLKETACNKFFHTDELTAKIRALKVEMPELQRFSIPTFNQMTFGALEPFVYNKSWEEAMKDPILVLQTSGSTGPPKPIVLSNEFIATFDNHHYLKSPEGRQMFSMASVSGRYYSAYPSFHMSGVMTGIAAPILMDSTTVIGPSTSIPSGDLAIQIIQTGRVRKLFLPPSVIEQLPRDKEALKLLDGIDWIATGGGPLTPAVGDDIVKRTTVCQIFGQTETGWPPMLILDQRYWSFLEFYPGGGSEMESNGDGLYELVVRKDQNQNAHVYQGPFVLFPELNTYRTKDLFSRHPSQPNLWKFEGRSDDIIVLSNGEKFNPVPMELIIQGHPSIMGALIAGHGRFRSALLVEPKPGIVEESVVEMIWPIVEAANMAGPKHARISKSMIICAIRDKPFVRTGKGSTIRKHTLRDYEEELERQYSQSNIKVTQIPSLKGPVSLTSVQSFVRSCVFSVVQNAALEDDDDFFALGMDSLGVLDLGSLLTSGLGRKDTVKSTSASRMIFANETINKLSQAVFDSLDDHQSLRPATEDPELLRTSRMQALMHKYTNSLPEHLPILSSIPPETRTILLTGSTGSLGSSLLANLLFDSRITKIYCLNRSKNAADRHEADFERRNLELSVLQTKAEFLQVDLSHPDFGLTDQFLNLLGKEVDMIIHNAWQVDFNLGLPSFEAVHIRGLRNIIDFSLKSNRQPRIFFTSSISVAGNWTRNHEGKAVPETVLDDYADAQPHGYGESKHVAERILAEAAKKTGLPVTILRIGQIAGSTCENDPAWNKDEMVPIIIKTSKAMRKVPRTLGKSDSINWIPLDTLVEVFGDLVFRSLSAITRLEVLNLVNPRSASWQELLRAVNQNMETEFEVISYLDWVNLVVNCKPGDAHTRPALKLIDFLADLGCEEPRSFETASAEGVSATMARIEAVTPEMMELWVKQWGF